MWSSSWRSHGLTTALQLKKRGLTVIILEKSNRTGGQIATHREGVPLESGPNTGSGASKEVMELYDSLSGRCEIEFAAKEAESRWIWKKRDVSPTSSSLMGGITTPLFTPWTSCGFWESHPQEGE